MLASKINESRGGILKKIMADGLRVDSSEVIDSTMEFVPSMIRFLLLENF
jgi:hypothetical protein